MSRLKGIDATIREYVKNLEKQNAELKQRIAELEGTVVELPSKYVNPLMIENEYESGYEYGFNSAVDSCKSALYKAGISYE